MVAEEINVLMVTIALQSHLNPILKLANRLVSKGIHITVATNDVGRRWMLRPGISLVFFSDGLSPEFDRLSNVDSFINSIWTTGRRNLSNLIANFTAENKKFSCIIYNPFMPWMPDVSAEHSMPCAPLWIQPCTVFSVYYHFFKDPNLFPSFNNPNESIELPGMPVFEVRDLPNSFIIPSAPPSFYRILLDFFQSLYKVKWVLVNSATELEEEIVNSMGCLLPVGPLVSPFLLGVEENRRVSVDMWKADNSCIEWLDNKPDSSVIYVSFGSLTGLSQKQMDRLAMGLKNINRPFLWVIKPAENSELPPTFLEDTKGKGLVVTWCSQEKVLMHKAVGCFITHCGWNSALETVVAGLPIIVYPNWSDQPAIAKYFVDVLKIGVRIKVEDEIASAEEVERCIVEITTGPEAEMIKKRALEMKKAAKKAVADGGSSDLNIDRFISEIVGSHSN